uniref:Uncharacterized protein n=1 Tax=Setaria digitata TaxID=48799 RepID=A0A915Q6X0_9BILA
MLEGDDTEPPKEIIKNELSTLSANITNCLSAVSFKIGSDKKTIDCVEECVIAAEELQTLGGLVKTDIKAVSDSVATISEQIEQLEGLFRNIDRLEEFVKQINFLVPEFIEIERDSEDDCPVEVSSKLQRELRETPGRKTAPKLKDKKLKRKAKRRKKYEVVKLNEGVYKSETKTSTFKVVPLSTAPLQPLSNFRSRLLQKRTKNQRLTKMEQAGLQHKNKWFAVTRPGRR